MGYRGLTSREQRPEIRKLHNQLREALDGQERTLIASLMAQFLFVAKPETNPDEVRVGIRTDWSCSAKAKAGDKAFLYITGGTGITEEWFIDSRHKEKVGRYYRCDVHFLREIDPSVTIRELKALAPKWAPAQQNLRGHHALEIPREVCERIYSVRPISLEFEIKDLEQQVKESRALSKSKRGDRLRAAERKPEKIKTVQSAFRRNPDVIAEALERARGICERCKAPAPFVKKSSHQPYLEVHHRIPLADGGDDTVENAIALCPNCHRYEHYA